MKLAFSVVTLQGKFVLGAGSYFAAEPKAT